MDSRSPDGTSDYSLSVGKTGYSSRHSLGNRAPTRDTRLSRISAVIHRWVAQRGQHCTYARRCRRFWDGSTKSGTSSQFDSGRWVDWRYHELPTTFSQTTYVHQRCEECSTHLRRARYIVHWTSKRRSQTLSCNHQRGNKSPRWFESWSIEKGISLSIRWWNSSSTRKRPTTIQFHRSGNDTWRRTRTTQLHQIDARSQVRKSWHWWLQVYEIISTKHSTFFLRKQECDVVKCICLTLIRSIS